MPSTLKQFKTRALSRPGVRKAYAALEDEFAFLDEVLKARASSGLTQAQLAERVGTTQSAIARLESGARKPSVATLQRYASALGYRVEIKLVKSRDVTSRSTGRATRAGERRRSVSAVARARNRRNRTAGSSRLTSSDRLHATEPVKEA